MHKLNSINFTLFNGEKKQKKIVIDEKIIIFKKKYVIWSEKYDFSVFINLLINKK